MSKWAYEYTNRELVDVFANACARAGVSGSGLVISAGGGDDVSEAKYLKGVMLARLEGETPPFKRGDIVEVNADRVLSLNCLGGYPSRSAIRFRRLERGTRQEIQRIHYLRDNEWSLEFANIEFEGEYFVFYAKNFMKVPKPVK